jgi:hypothetical protein
VSEATQQIERPALGSHGEPCRQCGAPLARDQRYCLACGARRAGLSAVLSEPQPTGVAPPAGDPAAATPGPESPWRLDAGLLAGVACLLLALGVGVLIGGSGRPAQQRPAPPQVVTVGGAAAAPAATAAAGAAAAPASFKSDWPSGKRGFTVQLQTLAKAGNDPAAVAAAKRAAAAKGAPAVGALDSDAYAKLRPGRYVIFSGRFADRKAAQAALKRLAPRFPGAKVIEVSANGGAAATKRATGAVKAPSKAQQAAGAKAIQEIQNATGKDYSKKSAKLPKTLVTPGKPPPTDTSRPAGGGSSAETFK